LPVVPMSEAERGALRAIMETVDKEAGRLPPSSRWRGSLVHFRSELAVCLGEPPLAVVGNGKVTD
jgi:hypothetical protein